MSCRHYPTRRTVIRKYRERVDRVFFRKKKKQDDHEELAKLARLEEAEREVTSLSERKDKAISMLDARHGRNHWRESIEEMIQGAL